MKKSTVDTKDFNKDIDNLKDNLLPNNITRSITKACLLVQGEAKEECPFDEGFLSASIDYSVEKEKGEITGYVGTNKEYAIFVHEGTGIYATNGQGRKTPWKWTGTSVKWKGTRVTRGQKPKPFLRNALEKNREKIKKILSNGLKGGS